MVQAVCACGYFAIGACVECHASKCSSHVPGEPGSGYSWSGWEKSPEGRSPLCPAQDLAHAAKRQGYWRRTGLICHECRLRDASQRDREVASIQWPHDSWDRMVAQCTAGLWHLNHDAVSTLSVNEFARRWATTARNLKIPTSSYEKKTETQPARRGFLKSSPAVYRKDTVIGWSFHDCGPSYDGSTTAAWVTLEGLLLNCAFSDYLTRQMISLLVHWEDL